MKGEINIDKTYVFEHRLLLKVSWRVSWNSLEVFESFNIVLSSLQHSCKECAVRGFVERTSIRSSCGCEPCEPGVELESSSVC